MGVSEDTVRLLVQLLAMRRRGRALFRAALRCAHLRCERATKSRNRSLASVDGGSRGMSMT